ncbi:hypothetical protein B0H13DRAFT_1909815 [Mycena leptocephala]|nr:hypothetical protein B0H13DRAFT_1909815 [Mycena leptocephala]
MYLGSGGFSPAVRNLSSGALGYWIECNFASCIEFMYPGSAGLIATPVEPNPSSAALDYCRNFKGNFQKRTITCNWGLVHDDQSHKEVLRIWVTNYYLPDLYLVLFEALNNLAPPRSVFIQEVLRIWVTNYYLPDLYLILFEALNNLAPPRSVL